MSIATDALQKAGLGTSGARTPAVRGPVAELAVKSAHGAKGTARKVLHGVMVPFDEWIRVDSIIEGRFYESWAPGSTDKTFAENRGRMRCILYHGKSGTSLGKLPIGKILDLHADGERAYYEVELFNDLPGLLLEGLEAGEYGTSVFYECVKPDFTSRPEKSEHNPEGWPELRVVEAKIIEFGPTPFAFYEGATAAMRSMTDDLVLDRLAEDPERMEAFAERMGMKLAPIEEASRERSAPQFEVAISGDTSAMGIAASPNVSATGPSAGLATLRTTETPRARRRYERACQYVETSFWMMHPQALSTVIQIISERIGGYRPSAEEIAERIGYRERATVLDVDEPDDAKPTSPVRVIPITGTLVPHSGMFADVSEAGRAVEDIRAELRDAMNDEDVQSILLEVDSPGGSAELIPELAAEMRAMRDEKPIWAIANTFAASGAYYLGSQANEFVVTPSGYVGSIGVYTVHDDLSGKLEAEGITKSIISAGKYKVEGNPFEPLSDDAREYRQEQIDEIYKLFVADVAKGRGASVKDVEADFGQGRMVRASKAVERGMADRVATFDQTLARMAKLKSADTGKERAAALSPGEPEPPATTRTEPTPRTNLAGDGSRRTRRSDQITRKEESWHLSQ